jgi:hypothetical protein
MSITDSTGYFAISQIVHRLQSGVGEPRQSYDTQSIFLRYLWSLL